MVPLFLFFNAFYNSKYELEFGRFITDPSYPYLSKLFYFLLGYYTNRTIFFN
ncbi:hypothetical protein HDF22_004909 [Mucilaginibacter lappiensis]|uniref:Uncharacterized protein n=1 Tax=Mucilaginibacter lappiensis TaxID=354630 RepID=A0A841JJV7_9SPHI|nr:hypothetical protein [Mucilaginibacter lappiensis]